MGMSSIIDALEKFEKITQSSNTHYDIEQEVRAACDDLSELYHTYPDSALWIAQGYMNPLIRIVEVYPDINPDVQSVIVIAKMEDV